MNNPKLKTLFFALLLSFVMTQVAVAQQKPKVFFSDDFLLDNTSAPNYLWFYGDQSGILEKTHAVSGRAAELAGSFAKSCDCNVVSEPDEADYVVFLSRYDLGFRPKLAEKKFVVIRVDGERLVFKATVRRASNIVSDSCKAILKDWS